MFTMWQTPCYRLGRAMSSWGCIISRTRLAVLLASLFVSFPALGQYPRDAAANRKIDEALNQHYLATDFKKAEDVLLGTIKACENKCKPSTLGRAWMYVGVVRGSGDKDQDGAREAFQKALEVDPAVTLDVELATPETRATFESVGGQVVAKDPTTGATDAAPPPAGATTEAGPAAAPTAAGLDCTPGATEVLTRQPVPVACRGDGEATAMSMRYLEFGADDWTTVNLTKVGAYFQGEIPCTATKSAGPLKYFVVATDTSGAPLDTFGNKKEPIQINVSGDTAAEPPSYPGQPPPERCEAEVICPPDFPGCGDEGRQEAARGNKDWGDSCDHSNECQAGLLCIKGACETAPSCVVDADCETGVCRAGKCDIPFEEGAEVGFEDTFILGLHFAQDVGFVSGQDVCRAGAADYDCFYEGTDESYPAPLSSDYASYTGEPSDAYPGGGIGAGAALGTRRVLASVDGAVLDQMTVGARIGFAFGGGPKGSDGSSFFPGHFEGRLSYWLLGLADQPFRPYVHIGGGMAQVDVKAKVVPKDCTPVGDEGPASSDQPEDYEAFVECADASGRYDSANQPDLPTVNLDAYRRLGQGFITAGGGVIFAIGSYLGAQLNLNAMYMLPSTGLVLEPSLGGVYAF